MNLGDFRQATEGMVDDRVIVIPGLINGSFRALDVQQAVPGDLAGQLIVALIVDSK